MKNFFLIILLCGSNSFAMELENDRFCEELYSALAFWDDEGKTISTQLSQLPGEIDSWLTLETYSTQNIALEQNLNDLAPASAANPEHQESTMNFEMVNSEIQLDAAAYRQILKTCEFCSQTFTNRTEWQSHLKQMHGKLVCPICDKPLSSQRYLNKHVQGVHEKNKKFMCERHNCQQKFGSKFNLQVHLQAHAREELLACKITGSKKEVPYQNLKLSPGFKCTICGQIVRDKRGLPNHLKTHLVDTACDFCSEKFINKQELKRHLKTSSCRSLRNFQFLLNP